MATERTVLVRLKADNSQFKRAMREAADSVDTTNDRTAWLAQSILALGPALSPLGAASVPVFTTMATGITLAGTAAISLGLAFNGIGDAVKALNAYQLEPTEANLKKLEQTMGSLSGEGQDFVRFLDEVGPSLNQLSDTAQANLFPGMAEGIQDLVGLLPEFNALIGRTSGTIGDLSASAGESLAGDDFKEFFEYLTTDGQRVLEDMSVTLGKFFEGFAGTLVAFGPLTGQFSGGLREMAEGFADWSHELDDNRTFQEFLDYIEESGPKVLDLLGSLITLLVDLAVAAAPVGDIMVPALTALAQVVSTLAETPFAPWLIAAAAALSIYGRAAALASVTTGGLFGALAGPGIRTLRETGAGLRTLATDMGVARAEGARFGRSTQTNIIGPMTRAEASAKRARGTIGGLVKTTGAVGLFAATTTGAADSIGLSNTAAFAMAGTLAGPWGAAVGGAIGLAKDLSDNSSAAASNGEMLNRVLENLETAAGPKLEDRLAAVNGEIARLNGMSLDGVAALARDVAVDTYTARAEDLQHELDKTAAATDFATSAAGRSAAASEKQAAAFEAVKTQARNTGGAFTEFGEDLDDSKVSLDKWIDGVRDQAVALEQFTANTLRASDRGLDSGLVADLASKGPAGALRMKQLADGTAAEIRRANREFRRGEKAIDDYEAAMAGIAPVEIEIRTLSAEQALARFLAQARNNRVVIPITSTSNATTADREANNGVKKAAGGMIYGPGTTTSDSVPAMLSNREYVIKAAAVEHYGPGFFDAANQMRLASGGWVQDALEDTRRGRGLRGYIRSDLDMKYPTTLKQWNAALEKSTKVLDKERSKREDLLAQADGIRTAIQSNYRSDLFGKQSSNPWMSAADRAAAGKGDVFATLTGDIQNANALAAAEKKLKKKGLDSGAFAELVSNASLDEVLAFANGSTADVQKYERLYNQREKSLATAGNVGASAAFGAQLAASKAEIVETKAMRREIVELRKDVEKAGRELKASIRGAAPIRPSRGR